MWSHQGWSFRQRRADAERGGDVDSRHSGAPTPTARTVVRLPQMSAHALPAGLLKRRGVTRATNGGPPHPATEAAAYDEMSQQIF
jgi:hypothetical protein